MAADHLSHYREFLIILGVAGLIVPLFLRLGISGILGFLLVGFLMSPDMLGQAAKHVSILGALAITNPDEIAALAELGVVFLLFLIGLELSPERLLTMKRLVFGFGGLQVIVTTAILGLAAHAMGFAPAEAVVLGMALSLSSTAIVIQLFSDEKRLGSSAGRASFGVLLFQDLAVIPILLTVSVLTQDNQGNILKGVLLALGQAALAIATIVLVGRFALRPFLKLVAGTRSAEHFMAAVLLIAVGTGAMAMLAGLSMALGAFIAGLMLAETEYRRAVEAIIEPFKGLLLGAFFLLVGLGLDLDGLARAPLFIIGVALALIAMKSVIVFVLARFFGINASASLETALLLGPCGEFAFVVLAAASSAGLFAGGGQSQVLLIVSLTMALIPLLGRLGRGAIKTMRQQGLLPPEALVAPPSETSSHVVVAGFGRVGHLVASMLEEHKIPYVAVDADAALVSRERRNGAPVYYGDAANPEFLRKCGIATARALAITMDSPSRVDDVTRTARQERPDLKIIARARDERHAMKLYSAGVSEAVPETIESSLQLAESILVESGVPMGLAIASVHERRDGFRKLLGRPDRRAELKQARASLRRPPAR
jgi:CPA2 family monovalent cation:H+ antiporter-2